MYLQQRDPTLALAETPTIPDSKSFTSQYILLLAVLPDPEPAGKLNELPFDHAALTCTGPVESILLVI